MGSLDILSKEALMSCIFQGIQNSVDLEISLKVTFKIKPPELKYLSTEWKIKQTRFSLYTSSELRIAVLLEPCVL